MEPRPPEHAEPEIDALLRDRRPRPGPDWVASTEARLFAEERHTARWWHWRPEPALRVGAAFALGLTLLLLAFSLIGVGPFGGSSEPVVADDDCRTVRVTRVEQVPRIVEQPGTEPTIVYERKPVERLERRCR